ncbi:hypothetical protein GPJ56_009056 [Histomonas meleagridis]|uniref:uncharacterized protein n=1 Tax=Histomonas meleagridis TaxID=135588 RepID=UPI00355A2C9A|nr:hypothetical protein GPJ56_009056 [Histomonas meleagridis]KAH0799288.1 hypothetical protein GO595_008085 [Histomonas meleagridis]
MGQLRSFYYGGWTSSAISNLCEELFSSDVTYLNTTFDVFDFQHKKKPTLILKSQEIADEHMDLIDNFGGLLDIGIISDPSVVEKLDFPTATLTNYESWLFKNLTTINSTEISNLLISPYQHIHTTDQIGLTPTTCTLIALIDDRDPMHLMEISRVFNYVQKTFGTNLTFQFCDFFRCTHTVSQLKITSIKSPVFALHNKAKRIKLESYHNENKPESVLTWLKLRILGERPNKNTNNSIEKLKSTDFVKTVTDPNTDTIILLGNPSMPKYDISLSNTKILMELLGEFNQIKFYEFDPKNQQVSGVSLPNNKMPMFSVWPASATPQGYAMEAHNPIQMVIQQILSVIKTPIPDDRIQEMAERLQEILSKQ